MSGPPDAAPEGPSDDLDEDTALVGPRRRRAAPDPAEQDDDDTALVDRALRRPRDVDVTDVLDDRTAPRRRAAAPDPADDDDLDDDTARRGSVPASPAAAASAHPVPVRAAHIPDHAALRTATPPRSSAPVIAQRWPVAPRPETARRGGGIVDGAALDRTRRAKARQRLAVVVGVAVVLLAAAVVLLAVLLTSGA